MSNGWGGFGEKGFRVGEVFFSVVDGDDKDFPPVNVVKQEGLINN
jgi:hypothetical protein